MSRAHLLGHRPSCLALRGPNCCPTLPASCFAGQTSRLIVRGSHISVAGSDAARLADQWGAQEPDSFAATDVKPLFGATPKWDPLPQRDALGKAGGGHGGMLGGAGGDVAAGGVGKDAGGGGDVGAQDPKPPSPLDAFKLPVELEAGGGFGGIPPAGSDTLSEAAVGGFADAAAQPFAL